MKKHLLLPLFVIIGIISFAQDTKSNKEIITRFYNAFNQRNFNLFYSCFADSVLVHFSGNKSFMITPAQIKEDIDPQVISFPDSYDTISLILAEGNWVSIHVRHTGTYKDSLWGLPPNKKYIDYSVMEMYRLENNKIKEIYVVNDRFSMLQQMGIIPKEIKSVLKNTHD